MESVINRAEAYINPICAECRFSRRATVDEAKDGFAYLTGIAESATDNDTIEAQTGALANALLEQFERQFPVENLIYCTHREITGPVGPRIHDKNGLCTVFLKNGGLGFEQK
ncbi:MAG: hypothetical protein UU81_C0011G0014 [Microgenomates group bacterium GW2011_GWC1_41_8]|uniref:Uncharacterized protein n=2 Tax=Candidatus Roizmaniibacteriota TaxID=1752723 RepID=A0A0G0T387_9BACT|nr:MAG: hypothetical protein UU14_C0027G0018 [Candidatus Roizmanbacteria bacterium GW2011_GWB1_40_7]KKR93305.1 MAG: hypothetical protein UU41_C0021G0018 [Candidatus Roizmanbacteria bacterium GW2011_GWA1_41_13]KKS24192.1 MAG: hypothetical protein UU81_C0011G0014 [Microgenomates group bacterium GW2011_GWC1_41_8]